eukprot:c43053_g1_i1 orf=393-692(-)
MDGLEYAAGEESVNIQNPGVTGRANYVADSGERNLQRNAVDLEMSCVLAAFVRTARHLGVADRDAGNVKVQKPRDLDGSKFAAENGPQGVAEEGREPGN